MELLFIEHSEDDLISNDNQEPKYLEIAVISDTSEGTTWKKLEVIWPLEPNAKS
jgi:hypothetical protein